MKIVICSLLIFIAIGVVINLVTPFVAEVNIRIRPELKNLNFWEACVSRYFWEWFWYKYPIIYVICTMLVCSLVGLGIGVYIEYG